MPNLVVGDVVEFTGQGRYGYGLEFGQRYIVIRILEHAGSYGVVRPDEQHQWHTLDGRCERSHGLWFYDGAEFEESVGTWTGHLEVIGHAHGIAGIDFRHRCGETVAELLAAVNPSGLDRMDLEKKIRFRWRQQFEASKRKGFAQFMRSIPVSDEG